MNQRIGIIDSGVGGLTVAKEVMKTLPHESIVYFGDDARCPYGNKTVEDIEQFTFEMVEYVSKFHLKALIIACNTATAVAFDKIKQAFPFPVIGVIDPGAQAVVDATKTKKIGVIATTRTIDSNLYETKVKEKDESIHVVSHACPLLVPIIEKGGIKTMEELALIESSLQGVKEKGIDALVLGCTHYPMIRREIQAIMGSHVQLIDPSYQTTKELSNILIQQQKLNTHKEGKHLFFTSGDPVSFKQLADNWLNLDIDVQHVSLAQKRQAL